MALKLIFSTNIRKAALMIENGEVQPFIDHKDTRYIIDIDRRLGTLIWTPFDIPSQELIGEYSYRYPFASHNMIFDAIFGPRNKNSPTEAIITEWPDYPILDDEVGNVIP
jgi:hypothetical protein